MATPVYAWSLRDGDYKNTGLMVHVVLVKHYFAVATQWPGEDPTWLTRSFGTEKEAHDYAILHTDRLEKSGDVMERGPVMASTNDQRVVYLDVLVDTDAQSDTLDELFDDAMMVGVSP